MSCADAPQHVRGGPLGFLGMLEPQPDAADIGFVGDIVGEDLDHAGAVLGDDALRQASDLLRVSCDPGPHHRNAVGGEQVLGFDFRQNRSAGAHRGLDDGGRLVTVEREFWGSDGGVRISCSCARA